MEIFVIVCFEIMAFPTTIAELDAIIEKRVTQKLVELKEEVKESKIATAVVDTTNSSVKEVEKANVVIAMDYYCGITVIGIFSEKESQVVAYDLNLKYGGFGGIKFIAKRVCDLEYFTMKCVS